MSIRGNLVHRTENDPGFIHNIDVNCGDHEQQYEVVINHQVEIIIVESGILESEDPLAKLLEFKHRGFKSYLKKINSHN